MSGGADQGGAEDPRPARPFDAPQLRLDTWNDLQIHTNWLYERGRRERPSEEPRALAAGGLETLKMLEQYWAFPGWDAVEDLARLLERGDFDELARRTARLVRLLVGESYRERGDSAHAGREEPGGRDRPEVQEEPGSSALQGRPYFEVLVVTDLEAGDRREFRHRLLECRRDEDEFIYDVVVVGSFEDAVIGVLFNRTIQSCVLRYNYDYSTSNRHSSFDRYFDLLAAQKPQECYGLARSQLLGRTLKALRPEVDLFLVTDTPLDRVAGNLGRHFRRAFYRIEQYLELHLSILKGIRARHEAPFFDALRRFSRKPTGVFHALPVARGKSMLNSFWARDLARFYGPNLFLAETSATSGGLDSLLQPAGPIKRAQEAAARAFGAQESFFVTNGTSTANKIVVQALVRPGDIVLASRDCHKSHHYAIMLAGAYPLYLDAYPLAAYSMYGAVPLEEIKRRLLELKAAGKLARVRMLLLTNCTFDGITYDPERVMAEVLAIKPDMIFVWDEAWFAFARFSPTLRRRTAMEAAARLRERYHSPAYRAEYARSAAAGDGPRGADGPPLPDPDTVRIRVYATHSTHKTLTALRQGSMIHVFDEDFEQKAAGPFNEAFMTHTSTSPNYQILASLDVGRRQVELEGYELVEKSIGLAMILRERIYDHPVIRRTFSVLRPADMIPVEYRPSGLEFYYDPQRGWQRMEEAWLADEFALDPTRVTVHVGRTGLDGNAFRLLLMDEHDIQINKTSRNSVLFMTNIGTTRGDVAYLVEVLARIAGQIEDRLAVESAAGRRLHRERVAALTEHLPPLPNFSRFHQVFQPEGESGTREGDLRKAFFLAYDEESCEHLRLDGSLAAAIDSGREVVSAGFVTPYPPGFPVLVPGQIVSRDILAYLRAVDVKEIHGYEPQYGLRVFSDAALEKAAAAAPPVSGPLPCTTPASTR